MRVKKQRGKIWVTPTPTDNVKDSIRAFLKEAPNKNVERLAFCDINAGQKCYGLPKEGRIVALFLNHIKKENHS